MRVCKSTGAPTTNTAAGYAGCEWHSTILAGRSKTQATPEAERHKHKHTYLLCSTYLLQNSFLLIFLHFRCCGGLGWGVLPIRYRAKHPTNALLWVTWFRLSSDVRQTPPQHPFRSSCRLSLARNDPPCLVSCGRFSVSSGTLF